eukprot:13934297-Heterocapsa_arctica.AAC.1
MNGRWALVDSGTSRGGAPVARPASSLWEHAYLRVLGFSAAVSASAVSEQGPHRASVPTRASERAS